MSDTYTLIAKNIIPLKKMDVDDRSVVGTYQLEVSGAENKSEGDVCEAILDQFHDNYGIETIDDFDICVFDPKGKEISTEMDSTALEDISVDAPEKISDHTTAPVPPAQAPRRRVSNR